jgi:hypothetical protein
MKTAEQVREDILNRFEARVMDSVEEGSILDIYTTVLGKEGKEIYDEIDRNRTPHIWSSLEGQQLDDTGTMLNIPRKTGESDTNYRYRIMNWVLTNEASNLRAINNALLLPKYASNIEFKPKVFGCGTGVCYVIPKEYTVEYITNSLTEAKEIIESVATPGLYVQYIVPQVKGVKLQVYMTTEDGDVDSIRSNIENKVLEYINNIPPYSYLQVGQINRIGVTESKVDYFSVLSVMIDGETVSDTVILQDIDTKLLYDEIVWTGE